MGGFVVGQGKGGSVVLFLVSNHSVIVFVCEGISSHFPTLKTFGDSHLCVCVCVFRRCCCRYLFSNKV